MFAFQRGRTTSKLTGVGEDKGVRPEGGASRPVCLSKLVATLSLSSNSGDDPTLERSE